tara:strand:+ start:159 stop:641 length:483 start_codon:yes stop_codon:yes gene_type:complete
MSVEYIKSITERYQQLGYAPYKWYAAETPPAWQPLKKPLSESRLGMLSTAGAYALGQVAYYYKDDTSHRAIPKDTPTQDLRFSHITENYLPDARQDPNCVLPLEHLREFEGDGVIGELAGEVFSCMGGVYSQRRVREELVPNMLQAFQAQAVDAALLIPL